MAPKSKPTLHVTNKWELFHHSKENRPCDDMDARKRKALVESMRQYGYLPAYPMHCVRRDQQLVIIDGQHRLEAAKTLKIAVYYVVVDDADVDIATINNTQACWTLANYANKWAAAGKLDYKEAILFAEQHEITLSLAINLLGNTADTGSGGAATRLVRRVRDGTFRIINRDGADRVAKLYSGITEHAAAIRTRFLIAALFAVCQVKDLEDARLITNAARCPESLMKYGSRDGYLDMLEHLYNYCRKGPKVPLKIAAENAMRARNPANQGKTAQAEG